MFLFTEVNGYLFCAQTVFLSATMIISYYKSELILTASQIPWGAQKQLFERAFNKNAGGQKTCQGLVFPVRMLSWKLRSTFQSSYKKMSQWGFRLKVGQTKKTGDSWRDCQMLPIDRPFIYYHSWRTGNLAWGELSNSLCLFLTAFPAEPLGHRGTIRNKTEPN